MKILQYDVVVIGAGLAGERAAIAAREKGCRVALVSLVPPRQSHSNAAQGGIQASLDNMGEHSAGDNWEVHFQDTVRGSDWGANQDVAERMVKLGPAIIRELEHWGTPFSRTEDGKIRQRNFGGTKKWRACYAADCTGHSLLYACDMKAAESRVEVFYRMQAISLVRAGGVCAGAICMDLRDGELVGFLAPATIMATGGYGRLYRESTNAIINRGDGMILALDAGCPLGNMEAVQFHPTGLYPSWILITEGARGDGGKLRNNEGKEFMWDYAPKAGNLASRDVVSRSEGFEIRAGRGFTGDYGGYLHLDITHLGAEHIQRNLRDVHDICRDFAGIDCVTEPIPIRPVQHYSMGGIRTDIDCHCSKYLPGLWACGEVACWDTHGFNRLGGNSLLETLVAGFVAGNHAAETVQGGSPDYSAFQRAVQDEYRRQTERIETLKKSDGREVGDQIVREIQDILMDKVGIFRNGGDLQSAVATLLQLKERARRIGLRYRGRGMNLELEKTLRVPGMVEVALTIAYGALQRTESRGSHYREDFPKRDDAKWLNRTLAWKTDGLPRLEYEEVVITRYPPGDRGY